MADRSIRWLVVDASDKVTAGRGATMRYFADAKRRAFAQIVPRTDCRLRVRFGWASGANPLAKRHIR